MIGTILRPQTSILLPFTRTKVIAEGMISDAGTLEGIWKALDVLWKHTRASPNLQGTELAPRNIRTTNNSTNDQRTSQRICTLVDHGMEQP